MDINMVLGGQDSVLSASSPDQAVSRLKHPCEEQVNDAVLRTQMKCHLPFLLLKHFGHGSILAVIYYLVSMSSSTPVLYWTSDFYIFTVHGKLTDVLNIYTRMRF